MLMFVVLPWTLCEVNSGLASARWNLLNHARLFAIVQWKS